MKVVCSFLALIKKSLQRTSFEVFYQSSRTERWKEQGTCFLKGNSRNVQADYDEGDALILMKAARIIRVAEMS